MKVNLFFALAQRIGPMRGASLARFRGAKPDAAAKRGLSPRPGVLDIAPYVPGTSALAGAHPVIKLSSNETPFGPSPRAVEAYLAGAAIAVALPGRLGAALARGDRQALRARSRAHRLRRRLRRAAQSAGQRLSRPRRRGDLQRARLPGLQDRHPGARRDAGRRAGDRPHQRCRCHPRPREPAHAHGVHRQSRTTRPAPISPSTR